MNNRFLGKIEVSPIGMGCMAFSHGYGQIPEEKYAIEAIDQAYHYGCTFFDTAEAYGEQLYYRGHNEQILGKAVESFRKKVVLATKIHFRGTSYKPGDDIYPILKEHLVQSLKNLRTDYVDVYYLHRINPEMPVEEVAEAFGRLIAEGLIRGWGLSQVSVAQLDAFNRITPVSAVQNLYNILERDVKLIFSLIVWNTESELCLFHRSQADFYQARSIRKQSLKRKMMFVCSCPSLQRKILPQTSRSLISLTTLQRKKRQRLHRSHWHGCCTNIRMSYPFPVPKRKSASLRTLEHGMLP
jgi:diketogulonate reductase-like aldo/keto reductase